MNDITTHIAARHDQRTLRHTSAVERPKHGLGGFSPVVKVLDALIRRADFTYTDLGVHDRTHLRFFTRSTMIEMFNSTGYDVASCTPTGVAGSRKASLIARLPWMPGNILAQQFVIVATLRSQTTGVAS